jgi:hypothetical protein
VELEAVSNVHAASSLEIEAEANHFDVSNSVGMCVPRNYAGLPGGSEAPFAKCTYVGALGGIDLCTI